MKLPIVLLSSDYLPNIGGIAAHVHELARTLKASGQPVSVLTRRHGPSSWFSRRVIRDGVTAVEVSLASLPGGYGRGWLWRRGLREAIRQSGSIHRPVVVHSHWDDLWFVHSDVVRVFTNHSSMFLQDLENERSAEWQSRLSVFDWVIAPSRELADKTVEAGFDRDRTTYVPNGVDTERYKPDPFLRRTVRQELGLDKDDVVIICARRFAPKNGVIDFAHALRFLTGGDDVDRLDRVVVLFAGNSAPPEDAYEMETIGAIRQSSVGRRSRLLGKVPNSAMRRLYAAADISILPSLKEATSITGLESMACGLPLVGTTVGGIPDLIQEGQTGFLVQHGDPRALAVALDRLIANPDLRGAMGAMARERAIQNFDWKYVMEQTREVYGRAAEIHSIRSKRSISTRSTRTKGSSLG